MEQSKTTSWLHNGTLGDVIASLPGIRQHYLQTGRKAKIYLVNGQPAHYYEGATHPTKDASGKQVMLNEKGIQMLCALLRVQEYVELAKIWENEPITIDLNQIRETFINMPYGDISRWYFYVFPDMACDLSQKWLTIPETDRDFAKGKIIITRTERYLNQSINYSFLRPFQEDMLFVGTELEHAIFCMRFGLNVKRLVINDFLELAQALSQCKFHISNQTMAFQISQGIKIPRIVELCSFAPNVIPVGENAFDFYAQQGLEYYFHRLNGTLDEWMNALRAKAKLEKPV